MEILHTAGAIIQSLQNGWMNGCKNEQTCEQDTAWFTDNDLSDKYVCCSLSVIYLVLDT